MTNWSTCPYCCGPIAEDPEGFEPEHVVPSAIGGNLTVPSGGKCNREVGKYFDQPMLNDRRVQIRRAVYGIRPMRRNYDPGRIGIPGLLSVGGGRAIWRPGDAENTITMVTPSDVVDHGDGHFSFSSPVENHGKHVQRVLDQLAAANPGKKAELTDSIEQIEEETHFEHSYGLGTSLWPRFAAKVALCLGGLTFGEPWFTSDESWMLRGLLRQDKTYKNMFPPGFELPIMPTEMDFDHDRLQARLHSLLLPTEHYLAVLDGPGASVQFVISLFGGELQYRLRINSQQTAPAHGQAWLLDGKGSAEVMRNDTLVGWLALREDWFGSPTRCRRDVPHPKFVGIVRAGKLTPIHGDVTEDGGKPSET